MWNARGNLVLQGHEDLKTNRVHRIFDYLCKIHLMKPWFPFPIRWLVHLEIHINFVGNKNYFLLKILSRKPSFLIKNLTDWHEESLQTWATRDWSHSWRKMTAGHGIWLLQLFVYFFRVCEVRQSMGKRNYNLTTSRRNSRKFFSCVLYYSPNRDAGSNPCEIPLDCIHLNPGTVKNPCAPWLLATKLDLSTMLFEFYARTSISFLTTEHFANGRFEPVWCFWWFRRRAPYSLV